jgi:hypothetical protein
MKCFAALGLRCPSAKALEGTRATFYHPLALGLLAFDFMQSGRLPTAKNFTSTSQ